MKATTNLLPSPMVSVLEFERPVFNPQFLWITNLHFVVQRHALIRKALWTQEVFYSWGSTIFNEIRQLSRMSLQICIHSSITFQGSIFIHFTILITFCFREIDTLRVVSNDCSQLVDITPWAIEAQIHNTKLGELIY